MSCEFVDHEELWDDMPNLIAPEDIDWLVESSDEENEDNMQMASKDINDVLELDGSRQETLSDHDKGELFEEEIYWECKSEFYLEKVVVMVMDLIKLYCVPHHTCQLS